MKKVFLLTLVISFISLISCNPEFPEIIYDDSVVLIEGALILSNAPTDVKVTRKNELITGHLKRAVVPANEYRWKLVAEMGTLAVVDDRDRSGGTVRNTQATHVKFSTRDLISITHNPHGHGSVFVSYNNRGTPNIGGLAIFNYLVGEGSIETASVVLDAIGTLRMPRAQINAVDYDPVTNRLYMVGANEDTRMGYRGDSNLAFVMVMELNPATGRFILQEPVFIKQLTSFQATSVKKFDNKLYVTVGDGTRNTHGGLYIFDESDNFNQVGQIIRLEHARSVDVDETGIYVFQANSSRVTRYNLDGTGGTLIFSDEGRALQKDAKSELLVWNDIVFVTENEAGMTLLDKTTGRILLQLERPGDCPENQVMNSISINSDRKRTASGQLVQSDLLLIASGQSGMIWYDIIKDDLDITRLMVRGENTILQNMNSVNFVESRGNIAFVADGLGGLKVLYLLGKEDDNNICVDGTKFYTFLKDNGNDRGNPYNRKVGDVFVQVEGDNLVVYLFSVAQLPDDFIFVDAYGVEQPNVKTIDLRNAGVMFGPNLKYFEDINLLRGNGNMNNGVMNNHNHQYRQNIPGGVKFTFPMGSKALENGTNLMVVYSGNGAWGYGDPNGPSGTTGTGAHNNGQIITLGDIVYCFKIQR
jgi:hypothetical protein